MSKYTIGIDLGGTTMTAGIVNENYEIVGKLTWATRLPRPAEDLEKALADLCRTVARDNKVDFADIKYVGIGTPGSVNFTTGFVGFNTNFGYYDWNLGPDLEALLGCKVYVENDANAAAMGEAWLGSAKGVQNVVMVTIGTGVGGGVIVNGDVVSGVVGAGGEIGHMCLNPAEERTCGCGGHGHLEQYSSATGVVSNYLAECKKAGVEPIELTGPSDSKDVFQACREGDKLALAAADTMADYLGRALALIANVVDPEMFLIGGGASASADVYLDKVREHFKQYALSASRETPIKVASLGNDAGIIGAAYVALRAAGK